MINCHADDDDEEDMTKTFLRVQNGHRENGCITPLTWDDRLKPKAYEAAKGTCKKEPAHSNGIKLKVKGRPEPMSMTQKLETGMDHIYKPSISVYEFGTEENRRTYCSGIYSTTPSQWAYKL